MPKKTHLTVHDFLDTAFDMVMESGWRKLSITALAKQMGCSTMPVYSHFTNIETLRDAVVKKGWDKVRSYESVSYTNDPWIDPAIGYVMFARDHCRLFACMLDSRNLALERQMLQEHWDFLSSRLGDYPGFDGLSPGQCRMIRYSRAIFTQGVATTMSKGWGKLRTEDEVITKYLTIGSQAILEGYRKVYDNSGKETAFLDDHFQPLYDR